MHPPQRGYTPQELPAVKPSQGAEEGMARLSALVHGLVRLLESKDMFTHTELAEAVTDARREP